MWRSVVEVCYSKDIQWYGAETKTHRRYDESSKVLTTVMHLVTSAPEKTNDRGSTLIYRM